MRIHLVAVMTAGVALGGCAGTGVDFDASQIFGPSSTEIHVSSEPAGAQVRIAPGEGCSSTPCTVKAPGTAETYVITVSKPGFLDQSVEVAWTTYGEGSEAQRQLFPNPVSVLLEPAPPAPSKKKPTKKPAKKPTTPR
jgi:hypothetical protein